MEPNINVTPMTPGELQRLLATTPVCRKSGIIEDNGMHYLVLLKTEKSKRPVVMVPVVHVIDAISIYFDNEDLLAPRT